jgi:hypothetical protein
MTQKKSDFEMIALYQEYEKNIEDSIKSALSCAGCGGDEDCIARRLPYTFYAFAKDKMSHGSSDIMSLMLDYLYEIIDGYVKECREVYEEKGWGEYTPEERDINFMRSWEAIKRKENESESLSKKAEDNSKNA